MEKLNKKTMGNCCASKGETKSTLENGLTVDEVFLIRQSWKTVSKASDMMTNGANFYVQLFQKHPETMELFPYVKGMPIEEVRKNPDVRAQALALMHGLDNIVGSLEDIDLLVALVKKNARRHERHIGPAEFEVMNAMFVPWLESTMGKQYKPAHGKAWEKLLALHLAVITEAYDELRKQESDGPSKDMSASPTLHSQQSKN